MDRQIMMMFSAMISRVLYLDDMDRQYGGNRGRNYEREAIEWAIHELAEKYPAEVAEAEIVAEDRERRRAERKATGR